MTVKQKSSHLRMKIHQLWNEGKCAQEISEIVGISKASVNDYYLAEIEMPPGEKIRRAKEYRCTHDPSAKPVSQYSLDGTFIKEFPSISAAANFIGVGSNKMSYELSKMKRHLICGSLWYFTNKEQGRERL